MASQLHRETNIQLSRRGIVGRRDFIRTVSAAAIAGGALPWTDAVAAAGDELRKRGMSCILLWMKGGPSQFETFSPKPGHSNGGETKAISTSVPGIQIADNMPHCAKVMDDLAIIRSMTSKEGNHSRASFLLHHGYIPTASVKFPTLGSMISHEIGDLKNDLPNFVRIGNRGESLGNGGFFGVEYDPFILRNARQKPSNSSPTSRQERFERRVQLLQKMDSDFGVREGTDMVASHRKLIEKTSKMVLSPQMDIFDIEKEPKAVREKYGESDFGTGCLMARRLVEAGVTFVEVTAGNWDTHDDVFNRCKTLAGQVDQPTAQLITDLKERGMLDKTLVIWMGEFGRTPKINGRSGRDHYPKAFNMALAGGGVRGGQVIGKTNEGGTQITDRPVEVTDLFRTIYTLLNIDADEENESNINRPIKVVDGGEVVKELISGA